MSERDKFAPVIEGFDCSGITDPYSYRCEPFYVDGENAGTLLDGSTVHDVLASKIRLSWNLTVLTPERYAALIAALEGADILDTVNALVYDATADAVRLASFHVTRPSCRAVNNFGATHIIPQSALVLEEASPIARFRVTPPDKLSYDIGETLDLSGLAVTAYDKDGAADDITAQCAVTPADGTPLLNPGSVPLTVAYDGLPVYSAAVTVADAEIIASGDFWTLYNTGTLYIYGVDTVPDTTISLKEYRAQIKRATIADGVTSIGQYAFFQLDAMEAVVIPDSVNEIGYGAFHSCSALKSVRLPNGVTSVGTMAFKGCLALESLTIPDSVTRIYSEAFDSCVNLTNVTIPRSVVNIGSYAFWRTGIRDVIINRNATVGARAFNDYCRIRYYDD